jgi:hypothetical protein
MAVICWMIQEDKLEVGQSPLLVATVPPPPARTVISLSAADPSESYLDPTPPCLSESPADGFPLRVGCTGLILVSDLWSSQHRESDTALLLARAGTLSPGCPLDAWRVRGS